MLEKKHQVVDLFHCQCLKLPFRSQTWKIRVHELHSHFISICYPLLCAFFSVLQPPSHSGQECCPLDRVVAQSKPNQFIKSSLIMLFQFVKKKKKLLKRRSKSINTLSVNRQRHNKHRTLLVIYQMRLMMKGRNDTLEQ